jgi:hypothetical protein
LEKEKEIYKEEKKIKGENKQPKSLIFSPNNLTLISVNEFKDKSQYGLIFLGNLKGEWKFLENFIIEAKSLDFIFTSDSSFQSKRNN